MMMVNEWFKMVQLMLMVRLMNGGPEHTFIYYWNNWFSASV